MPPHQLVDTIRCGNNVGLVKVSYYVEGQKVDLLPVGKTVKAVFDFEGNFKAISKKNSKFSIRAYDNGILAIKKIARNEFELMIHRKPDRGHVSYWMILQAPNTVFEWSWIEDGQVKHEYSKIWDVLRSHSVE